MRPSLSLSLSPSSKLDVSMPYRYLCALCGAVARGLRCQARSPKRVCVYCIVLDGMQSEVK